MNANLKKAVKHVAFIWLSMLVLFAFVGGMYLLGRENSTILERVLGAISLFGSMVAMVYPGRET